jgi:hypothetical protein
MTNKAIASVLLSATMVFAQGPGAFAQPGGWGGFGGEFAGGRSIVTGAPYSAVEVRQFTEQLADGNTINRTSETVLYRSTTGSTREEVTVTPPAGSGGAAYKVITISDVVAGKRYVLDSSTMTYHTMRIPTASASAARRGRGNGQARPAAPAAGSAARPGRRGTAATRADLGSQMKNGVLASGARTTVVTPAGRVGNAQPITRTTETWYCVDLKRAVEIKVSDPVHGDSTTELTNIVRSEPSADLFTVPAGYTEKNIRGGRGNFARGGRQGTA